MTVIISVSAARARGLKRYFTGAPCIRGHVSEKNTASTRCLACMREEKVAKRIARPKRQTLGEKHGDECLRLRDEGLNQAQIAARLGIAASTVHFILAPETKKEKIRRLGRERDYFGVKAPHRVEPKREPRLIVRVDEKTKADALKSYLNGEIDRCEMTRRTTPERPMARSPNYYRPIWSSVEEHA